MTEWGRPLQNDTLITSASLLHTHFTMSLSKSAWIMVMPLAVKHCPTLKHTHKHRRESVKRYTKTVIWLCMGTSWVTEKDLMGIFSFFTTVTKLYAQFEEFKMHHVCLPGHISNIQCTMAFLASMIRTGGLRLLLFRLLGNTCCITILLQVAGVECNFWNGYN